MSRMMAYRRVLWGIHVWGVHESPWHDCQKLCGLCADRGGNALCGLCIDGGGRGGEQVRNSAFSAIIEGFTATTYIMVHSTPYPPHPAPNTLHPTPHIPHPTPRTLNPVPHTLHPTLYTLHPTPYTLHPTSYTLHPSQEKEASKVL